MTKWLKKEYIIKTKVWKIIMEIILYSIILTGALYYFLTQADTIIDLLTNINKDHIELQCALIIFPLILGIVICIVIGTITTGKKTKK